ncbi:hypothetical protein ACOMHN_053008 [Nucella lapillus]
MNIQPALKDKSPREMPPRRLNMARLCASRDIVQERIQECLSSIDRTGEDTGEEWTTFKEPKYYAAADTWALLNANTEIGSMKTTQRSTSELTCFTRPTQITSVTRPARRRNIIISKPGSSSNRSFGR